MFWIKKKVEEPSVEECELEEISRTGPLELYGIKFKKGQVYFLKLMGKDKDGHWWELCSEGYSGRRGLEFARTTEYVEKILGTK